MISNSYTDTVKKDHVDLIASWIQKVVVHLQSDHDVGTSLQHMNAPQWKTCQINL